MSRSSRMSLEVKSLIQRYKSHGNSTVQISRILKKNHGVEFSRFAVLRYLKRTAVPKPRPQAWTKVTKTHYNFLQVWLQENSEQTATVIQKRFVNVFGLNISVSQVKIMRKKLQWTKTNRKYGQFVNIKNRQIRVQWCLRALETKETFKDVIFVDETCVEMRTSGKIFFYQKGARIECPTLKVPKPKHPYKVNVWGGISYKGRTDICIFTGVMDSVIYQQILERNFLPFVTAQFPDGYRLYQDNDSKHKSKSTVAWMESKNMLDKVMTVPASSPDLNPIENVWGSMKDFLQTKIKPKTKEELVSGIKVFWEELSDSQCAKYIDHIHKAIPRVILNNGHQSGL